jgi:hypothetical protein
MTAEQLKAYEYWKNALQRSFGAHGITLTEVEFETLAKQEKNTNKGDSNGNLQKRSDI